MEDYIVSARKYRPSTFESVIGQKALTTTLKNAIATGKLAQAYLFCGPRGVGKTTCARIFAKTINCLNLTPEGEACNECESCKAFNEQRSFNIHELDAASNNSVDDIRQLVEQVRIPPQIGKYKVYIIDEVHMLSPSAFNAFLKTLEEPPRHAIFILATTEKQKILPTILSRCQIYDFSRIRVEDIVEHLAHVAQKEGIAFEPEALNVIAQKADGGMRDALSIFDQMVSFSRGNITYKSVIENLNVLDYEYYFKLTDYLLQGDVPNSLLLLNDVLNKGFDASNFINGLGSHFRDLLVSKDVATVGLLEVGASIREQYKTQAQRAPLPFLYKAMKLCSDCSLNYRNARNKRFLIECTLIQLAQLTQPDADVPDGGRGPKPAIKPIFNHTQVTPAATAQPVAPQQQPVTPTVSVAQQTPAAPATSANQPVPHTAPSALQQDKPVTNAGKPKVVANISELGVSIRKKANDETKPQEQTQLVRFFDNRPLTQEAVVESWKRFASQLPHDQVALKNRMPSMPVVLQANDQVEVTVENDVSAKQLNEMLIDIRSFMQSDLHNSDLSLKVSVKEVELSVQSLSRFEQYRKMVEKNPWLQHLQDRLGLELN
ncbi:MAG: DNA polymerase III subunit gamma/tau [Bacteroidaceae bacterium]|nr:DNA polymerase III subunit gamma/tau [Bacteroidaceae bacterium]